MRPHMQDSDSSEEECVNESENENEDSLSFDN